MEKLKWNSAKNKMDFNNEKKTHIHSPRSNQKTSVPTFDTKKGLIGILLLFHFDEVLINQVPGIILIQSAFVIINCFLHEHDNYIQ